MDDVTESCPHLGPICKRVKDGAIELVNGTERDVYTTRGLSYEAEKILHSSKHKMVPMPARRPTYGSVKAMQATCTVCTVSSPLYLVDVPMFVIISRKKEFKMCFQARPIRLLASHVMSHCWEGNGEPPGAHATQMRRNLKK